ncbi:MAG: hypothetical protein JXR58_08260 [Bacteroidales bacterium]|nr:hypothetical protein [Bacteroidales bacterium]
MKKNYILIFSFFIASFFVISSCSDEKKADEKTKNSEKTEKTDQKEEIVDETMSIEAIAEKRAILDCQFKNLSKQIESIEDGDEKAKLQEDLAGIGEEINILNIEFDKYDGNQEDMELHQKIYKEKMLDCVE